jgi:hypothetical protein
LSASARTAASPKTASSIRWPRAEVPPATHLAAGEPAGVREDRDHDDEAGAVDAEAENPCRGALPGALAADEVQHVPCQSRTSSLAAARSRC